jgi:hypothetical protein
MMDWRYINSVAWIIEEKTFEVPRLHTCTYEQNQKMNGCHLQYPLCLKYPPTFLSRSICYEFTPCRALVSISKINYCLDNNCNRLQLN